MPGGRARAAAGGPMASPSRSAAGGGAPPVHVVVGANHRSAPLDLRERLLVPAAEMPAFYTLLKSEGFDEALLLSTCDRVEVHALHPAPASAIGRLRALLAARAGMSSAGAGDVGSRAAGAPEVDRRFYGLAGRAALRQLLAVAASLDSLIVGEPQVLGQLKESHRRAAAAGMVASGLERRLRSAYEAAKRVRSETGIGERAVSIASAAVEVARHVHGDLGAVAGLVLGTGEGGALIAARLVSHGLGRLAVLGERARLAAALAESLHARPAAPGDRERELAAADILVLAASAGRHTVSADELRRALKARRRRPIFVVDAGVPPQADPAIERLDDVFVYDLGHLERRALAGRRGREEDSGAAWAIVDEALSAFAADSAGRGAVPTVRALRARFEAARQEALAGRGGGDAAEATRRLVNRLLHDPSEVLRALAGSDPPGSAACEEALRRLFRLREEDGP